MIAVEVVFLTVFWTWAVSALLFLRNTLLPRMPLLDAPQRHGLPATTVHFKATDGLRLEGWKIPAEPSRPWIILCHGVGSNRADLLEIAAGLHAERFNLFLFDFRGHGGSAGRTTSFGWLEQRDVEGALAFLGQQPDVPARPYGVYGISMGASVALMVGARDERVAAVAADSPYSDLEETMGRHLTLMYRFPKRPFLWFVLVTYRLRFGVWPRHVSPRSAVAALSPRPLLLLQGADDPRTPLETARALYAAAGQPKDLYVIHGAGHLQGYAVDPPAYLQHLANFFAEHLASAPAVAES